MADLAGFVPEVWANEALASVLDNVVVEQICNTDYEGDIREYGDVVKINEIGDITITDYTPGSTSAITPQLLSDAQKELRINKSKSFSFWIDDVAKAQTKPKVMGEAMRKAANAVSVQIDKDFAALYTECGLIGAGSRSGATITGVDTTSTNVLKYISIAAQMLDENNAPNDGTRWMFVPPWFHQKIVLAKIALDTSNSDLFNRAFLGNFYGFNIFMSNNVTNGTPAADDACVMFGYRGSISLARQLRNLEAVRPSFYFRDMVKGLMLYGLKVVRPNQTGVLYLDYTAESS